MFPDPVASRKPHHAPRSREKVSERIARRIGSLRLASHDYCAVATIRYSDVDSCPEDANGVLLYIKPAILGRDEPRDVLQYSAANKAFPHQSTVDQLFDESQFESYRRLGYHVVDTLAAAGPATYRQFVEQIYARHLTKASDAVKTAILDRLRLL